MISLMCVDQIIDQDYSPAVTSARNVKVSLWNCSRLHFPTESWETLFNDVVAEIHSYFS